MALDTAQKRGSAIGVGQSWRPWLTIPDGTLASTDRLSLLRFAAAIAPAAPAAAHANAPTGRTFLPALEDRTFLPALEDRVFTPLLDDRTYTVEAS